MALRDVFEEAPVLDSLSWMGLSHKTRVRKAAHLYLKNEKKIGKESRSYGGPTKGIVKTYITSLFQIPRGMGVQTVEDTLREIGRQRKIRERRAENPPYRWKKRRIEERRATVAERHYRIIRRDYDQRRVYTKASVAGMSRVAGCFIIADQGGYHAHPRIFLRDEVTQRVKVVVLEPDGLGGKTLPLMLLHLAPRDAIDGIFRGRPITLDFHNEGFVVEGKSVPWQNVRKVYRGPKAVLRTAAKPKKKDGVALAGGT